MEQFPRSGLTTILSPSIGTCDVYEIRFMKFIVRRHISHLLQLSLVHLTGLEPVVF